MKRLAATLVFLSATSSAAIAAPPQVAVLTDDQMETVTGGTGFTFNPCCFCPPSNFHVKGNNGGGNGTDPLPPGWQNSFSKDFNSQWVSKTFNLGR